MTKRPKLLVIAGVVGISLVLLPFLKSQADSSSTQPGSVDDPVVTKSYVDQVIAQKVAEALKQAQSGGVSTVTPIPTPTPTPTPTSSLSPSAAPAADSSPDTAGYQMTVVQLQAGQVLYAGPGAEFIVRTGKTVAVSHNEDGIPDATAGKDIPANDRIDNNHLLIFPKDDGRGIKPDPKNNAEIWVMVRGSYRVQNDD